MVVVVSMIVLLAPGCGAAGDRGAGAPAAAPSSPASVDQHDPGASEDSQGAAAAGPTLAPAPGTSLVAIPGLEPVIPPPDVALRVLAAAQDAAPASEMSLQDCTDWIADPAISLEPAQKQECAAKLAAAVDTCRELDCFADPVGTVPAETTPPDTTLQDSEPSSAPTTTSAAPETTAAPSTTPPIAPAATAAPSTTASAAPETTAAPSTTASAAPETTAAPSTTPAPSSTTAPPTTAPVLEPDPGPAPEGGHPPRTRAGMVPRDEPYWDYPTCDGSPPWPSSCYPPSEWEVPQDLSGCRLYPLPDAGVGGICASRRPDGPPHQELPRQTQDVQDFMAWCQASWHPLSCEYVLFQMKWSLDYLGAHPWCVLQQYYDRIAAHDDIWNRGAGLPADMRNRHGWHLCPTVIDPGLVEDPGRRLSETGMSLADQCRIVLPPDVQLEDIPRRSNHEVQRFGSDCDAWGEWVETRPYARDWRGCDRSARLAEEWMEHHYGTPERYSKVYC